MRKIFLIMAIFINFTLFCNDINVNIDSLNNTTEILNFINKKASDWYLRNINVKEPLSLNNQLLLNTIFLVPTDDPMGEEYYELIFYNNGLFIYGSNFWGAQIEIIGNYEIDNNFITLSNFKKINKSKNMPSFFNLKDEAYLEFKEINYLRNKYGLVESNTNFTFILAGIDNDLGEQILINGVNAVSRFDYAKIIETTTGYIKPEYESKFDITNHNIYDEVRNKVYSPDEDLLFYDGISILVLGEYTLENSNFYYCELPIMDEYFTKIRLWIPVNKVEIDKY